MASPRRDGRPGNQFRRAAKLDEGTLIRIAFCFCRGISVVAAAGFAGLSPKSVRALYLEFRQRLTKPKFNRWHAAYQRLPWASSLDQEMLVRVAFLDVLADCYFNKTCWRNFTLGNRQARRCRDCLLPERFTNPEHVEEALAIVDAVRAFYDQVGIKGESSFDPVSLFRLRLIHTATIATARAENYSMQPRTSQGKLIPDRASFLSIWRLLDALLADLADKKGT